MAEGSRAEHLAWCKARALEYLDSGDPGQAITSFISDLGKWKGGGRFYATITLVDDSPDAARRWIEGFACEVMRYPS
jgi:hypothetical protein